MRVYTLETRPRTALNFSSSTTTLPTNITVQIRSSRSSPARCGRARAAPSQRPRPCNLHSRTVRARRPSPFRSSLATHCPPPHRAGVTALPLQDVPVLLSSLPHSAGAAVPPHVRVPRRPHGAGGRAPHAQQSRPLRAVIPAPCGRACSTRSIVAPFRTHTPARCGVCLALTQILERQMRHPRLSAHLPSPRSRLAVIIHC